MCCLPTADQSFWADLCCRRRLGPQWFWASDLTVKRMAEGITDALLNLEEYTKNAETMASAMANEDGVELAIQLLEREAERREHTVPHEKGRLTQ